MFTRPARYSDDTALSHKTHLCIVSSKIPHSGTNAYPVRAWNITYPRDIHYCCSDFILMKCCEDFKMSQTTFNKRLLLCYRFFRLPVSVLQFYIVRDGCCFYTVGGSGLLFYVQRDECYNSLLNSSADGKIFLYASGNSLLL